MSADCSTGLILCVGNRHNSPPFPIILCWLYLEPLPDVYFCPPTQVNVEKNYVVVEAGISLHLLHQRLGEHGLAMSNVGSISDQSLGGVITTATHGSGVDFAVIPSHVLELKLLLADGSTISCSRDYLSDLFLATLSGLGTTGFVLAVKLAVEPAFKLREVRQMVDFDTGLLHLDALAVSAEHVRIWWFPQQRAWRVMGSSRTSEVSRIHIVLNVLIRDPCPPRRHPTREHPGFGTSLSASIFCNSSYFLVVFGRT